MQWYDVVKNFYNDMATSKSLFEDLQNNYGTDLKHPIPESHLNSFCEWKQRPATKEKKQTSRKITFRTPQIALDLEGLGIYVRLPQQRMNSDYPINQVTWIIRSDDSISTIKADVYAEDQDRVFASIETEALLKPGKQYRFELFIDDGDGDPIVSWDIDIKDRNFLAFSSKGDLIKSQTITSQQAILVYGENLMLQGEAQISEHGKFLHSSNVISSPLTSSSITIIQPPSIPRL